MIPLRMGQVVSIHQDESIVSGVLDGYAREEGGVLLSIFIPDPPE